MTTTEEAIRAALAPAREAEITSAEVAHAMRDARRAGRQRRRTLTLAFGFAALLTTTATATGLGVFGWLDSGNPPGRELRRDDDAPAWVRAAKAQTVVAESGGAALYAVREADGEIGFALGDGVAISDTPEGWREQFDQHAIVVLGPGSVGGRPFTAQGRRPLFGVTGASVTRAELRYDDGAPQTVRTLHGGFVVLADPRRSLREVVAYDHQGREVERRSLEHLDLRVCFDERGCPPGRLEP